MRAIACKAHSILLLLRSSLVCLQTPTQLRKSARIISSPVNRLSIAAQTWQLRAPKAVNLSRRNCPWSRRHIARTIARALDWNNRKWKKSDTKRQPARWWKDWVPTVHKIPHWTLLVLLMLYVDWVTTTKTHQRLRRHQPRRHRHSRWTAQLHHRRRYCSPPTWPRSAPHCGVFIVSSYFNWICCVTCNASFWTALWLLAPDRQLE